MGSERETTEIPSQEKDVKSLEKAIPDRSKTQDLEGGKDRSWSWGAAWLKYWKQREEWGWT